VIVFVPELSTKEEVQITSIISTQTYSTTTKTLQHTILASDNACGSVCVVVIVVVVLLVIIAVRTDLVSNTVHDDIFTVD
jgi:hypothetical protein